MSEYNWGREREAMLIHTVAELDRDKVSTEAQRFTFEEASRAATEQY